MIGSATEALDLGAAVLALPFGPKCLNYGAVET